MQLTGQQIIGQSSYTASGSVISAVNPETGEILQPSYLGGSTQEVDLACKLAQEASQSFRKISSEKRARFLESIALEIEELGEILITRCMEETGLPKARLEGERARTCGQLRLFAEVLRSREWLDIRVDSALPNRKPAPREDLRLSKIALGPVAVFGASNFPLAFSVAGGDSAAAFAAGCPVIVKAHSAHPGTSELVGRAVQKAVLENGLHEGVFSLLYGAGNDIGKKLVTDRRIQAVGFTGSRSGGIALMRLAQSRQEPIPVYAEMSSINPVFLLPDALRSLCSELAEGYINSLNMGAGQFCTNPGLIIAIKSDDLDCFLSELPHYAENAKAQTMLSPAIKKSFDVGVKAFKENKHVSSVCFGSIGQHKNSSQISVFKASAHDFLKDKRLKEEVFGTCSLIVECDDLEQMLNVALSLEGQLTASLQMGGDDLNLAHSLLPYLEEKVGRIMVNAWPTGVEVCHAMVHGGPYPATSDSRSTSVGSAAIDRFLRPVCYQNFPQELLPEDLKDLNLKDFSKLLDGKRA